MIVVPPGLLVERTRLDGEAGRRWVDALPARVAGLCASWGLEVDPGPLRHGAHAVVVPVRNAAEPAVLKVSWQAVAVEASALRSWAGRGAVRLLDVDVDRRALLLERLDVGSLTDVALDDAAAHVGDVIRRLRGTTAPDRVPTSAALAAGLAATLRGRQRGLGDPVPSSWLDDAVRAATDLARRAGTELVHADLHWGNVLAGTREPWLAVDPRPVAGDVELSLPELLWTRADELPDDAAIRRLLETLVAAAGLDADRAHRWVVVRAVDYWLWGLEHGLTIDPERCRRVLAAVT